MAAGTNAPPVIVITGGSAGIGRAAAAALLAQKAVIVIVSRNPARVNEAIAQLRDQQPQGEVLGLPFDVSRADDMQKMADSVVDHYGRIDCLIAAAGILRARGNAIHTLKDTSVAEWNEIINVNLKGTFLSNRAVIPIMLRQRQGQIINVSSTSGRKGYAFDAAYCASKFGVIGFSQSLAEEVRPYGIRVQTVLPGAIETPMWDQNGPIPKPRDVLPLDHLARCIVELVNLTGDAVCPETIVEPLRRHERPLWSQSVSIANSAGAQP